MRFVSATLGVAGTAAVLAAATLIDPEPAAAVCSVFDRHPCTPTVCSVFRHRPCIPETQYPLGQDLRLTIETVAAAESASQTHARKDNGRKDDGAMPAARRIDTIREMFDALRDCWVPPGPAYARVGMQMSVRLSFKRNGEMIGTPRVTYTTPEATPEQRKAYLEAITATLDRCSPMPFTDAMGGAVAGRPIAIRFIDDRTIRVEPI
jgi:hypothetical protein